MNLLVVTKEVATVKMVEPVTRILRTRRHNIFICAESISPFMWRQCQWTPQIEWPHETISPSLHYEERFKPHGILTGLGRHMQWERIASIQANAKKIPLFWFEDPPGGHRYCRAIPTAIFTVSRDAHKSLQNDKRFQGNEVTQLMCGDPLVSKNSQDENLNHHPFDPELCADHIERLLP